MLLWGVWRNMGKGYHIQCMMHMVALRCEFEPRRSNTVLL